MPRAIAASGAALARSIVYNSAGPASTRSINSVWPRPRALAASSTACTSVRDGRAQLPLNPTMRTGGADVVGWHGHASLLQMGRFVRRFGFVLQAFRGLKRWHES